MTRGRTLVLAGVVAAMVVMVSGRAEAACGDEGAYGPWKTGLKTVSDNGNTVYHETLFAMTTAPAGCGASSAWWKVYASTYVIRSGSTVNYNKLYAKVGVYTHCGTDPFGFLFGPSAKETSGTYIANTAVARHPAMNCGFSSTGFRQQRATHKFKRTAGDLIYGSRSYNWEL